MESPLGPTLANAFLGHFKKKLLSECRMELLPDINRRYVDQIFLTFDSDKNLLKIVDYRNHQHPNIKFTFEVEKSNF